MIILILVIALFAAVLYGVWKFLEWVWSLIASRLKRRSYRGKLGGKISGWLNKLVEKFPALGFLTGNRTPTLYDRLGGVYGIAAVVNRLSDALIENAVV